MSTFKDQVAELVVEALNHRDRHEEPDRWSVNDMEVEDIEVTWIPDTAYGTGERESPEFKVKVEYRTSCRASGTVEVDTGAYLTLVSRKMLVWGS